MIKPFVFPPAVVAARARDWAEHEFFTKSVVLGIDIGMEGIGLYLRCGAEELWAKTVLMELPESEALLLRRQKRAWRHCRQNRDVRMKRLRTLMEAHGLAWPADDKMGTCGKSDPFILRLRAIHQGLGGPEALAICLRHAVTHRGYDYSLGGEATEGAYPWGEKNRGSDAVAWLKTATLDDEIAGQLKEMGAELEWKASKGKSEEERENERTEQEVLWAQLIEARLQFSREHNIARVLAEHAKSDKHTNLRERARGWNFPRKAVEDHIREILGHERHAEYIQDIPGFIAALFLKPRTKEEKDRAIFHYNRKTRKEMEIHWQKKTRQCPYQEPLGLRLEGMARKCAPLAHWSVRRWLILEFLATRRLILEVPPPKVKGASKMKTTPPRYPHRPGSVVIQQLLGMAEADHAVRTGLESGNQILTKDNIKAMLLEEARDQSGEPTAKLAPFSKETDPNRAYFSQMWDLLCPTAAGLRGTSSLCALSAEELFRQATGLSAREQQAEPDYDPLAIHRRLTDLEYYLWKRRPRFEYGCFPQVEKLTGPFPALRKAYDVRKKTAATGRPGPGLCGGLLGHVFRECQAALPPGCLAPDYCVIEVVGDPPRNSDQKKEILKEQQERRDKRAKAFEKAKESDTGVASRRRRVELHRQQGGLCPFTGQELGDPLGRGPGDEGLEIEHLFPQSRGGLSVDDNLVLTTRAVNADKGARTPFAFAGDSGRAWEQMLGFTKAMRWGAKKRELFAWDAPRASGEPAQPAFPEFGNTTRVSQLARQLKAAVQLWMGLFDDADESTKRIGTPTGWHTAMARRTWLPAAPGENEKNRANNIHHLIDAAVLAHIPPGLGLNSVECRGIFYSEMEEIRVPVPGSGDLRTFLRPVTRVLPGLLPPERLAHWRPANLDYKVCPILKLTSSSKWQAIGDATFWRQIDPGKPGVAQREALQAADFKDAGELLATLQRMTPGDPVAAAYWTRNLPSHQQIADWLLRTTPATKKEAKEKRQTPEPLLLRDGTPLKSVWKFDAKGSLKSAIGWSGRVEESGAMGQLRYLTNKFDRMEIWLGWNPKKKAWEYQRRLVPDATALKHLKRMGFIWSRDKSIKAPKYLQPKPEAPEAEWKSLREIVCPPLYPNSVKAGALRRGDVLQLALDGHAEMSDSEEPFWRGWFAVSSIARDSKVEMKSLLFKDKAATPFPNVKRDPLRYSPKDADVLASILKLPPAAAKASALGLQPPTPPCDDPPSNSIERRGGLSSGPGETDFRLA
jgi:HNH endonuclease